MERVPRPRVKICCIADLPEAKLAIRYGAAALGLVSDLRKPSDSVRFAFQRYTPEERAEVRSVPAMFGTARLAALAARDRVAEAVKGATELAGPAPLPVLKRR